MNEVPSHHRKVQRLLALSLPASQKDYDNALSHSDIAFGLIDQWFDFNCLDVLKAGCAVNNPKQEAGRAREFPLASLLTMPIPMQLFTSLPMLKALLLAGYVSGRPQTQVLSLLAKGAELSTRSGDAWKSIMPTPLTGNYSLDDALRHCQQHAEAKLNFTSKKSDEHVAWLESLKRWCDLLAQPALGDQDVLRLPENPVKASGDFVENAEPESGRFWIDFDDNEYEDEIAGEGDTEALAGSVLETFVPEAPQRHPRAAPDPGRTSETRFSAEARRARTGFRSALENQHLAWVNGQLSPNDAAVLVAAFRLALAEDPLGVPAAVGLLALAQVTGQLLEQAAALSLEPRMEASWLRAHDTLMHWVPQQPGAWKPDVLQRPLMRPHATHVPLTLPREVAEWLALRLPRDARGTLAEALGLQNGNGVAGARQWLSELRQRSHGLQTLGRTESWLAGALYQLRQDHVPLHLLCDTEQGHPCPSAYYRAYPVADLVQLHRQALLRAGWSLTEPTSGVEDGEWVGSRLNPHIDTVKAQWATFTTHCEAVVGDVTRPLHERHNARECHAVMLLMFQTLHRAVSDPIESLELIDLDSRCLTIADKQQGDTRAHRLVPLSALAARQCEEHIEHVRRLAAEVEATAPQTAARLRLMLEQPRQRSAPFRFLLDERLGIVRVTPARLLEAVAGVWSLPLNLARHFTSTWLLAQGVNDAVLSSLLGHHDLGTHNLSLLSPLSFEALFGSVRPLLDELALKLGLRSIPSFLAPMLGAEQQSLHSAVRPARMSFGHERREEARRRQMRKVKSQVDLWISDQLAGRPSHELTQQDVTRLFALARDASGNLRSYWAGERLEAMRDALLALQGKDVNQALELPAIALGIRDVGHQCPLDGLACARWLRRIRSALHGFWKAEVKSWRTARTSPYEPPPEALMLTLVVDSLLTDPAVWTCWREGGLGPEVFVDGADAAWVRAVLPGGNSRLYPVRREFAEMLARVPAAAWTACRLESVTRLANRLDVRHGDVKPLDGFEELLTRVLAGSAAEAPGLVLGYAGGAHGSVSPQTPCLERKSGGPPTQAAVNAWRASQGVKDTRRAERRDMAGHDALPMKQPGRLSDEAQFRERMALALRLMDRSAAVRAQARQRRAAELSSQPAHEAGGDERRPMRRFAHAIEQQSDDLMHSPALPRACGLAAQWLYSLARHGQKDGSDYAPKTLHNYWSSWALRFIEELGPINPVALSADEVEGLYLQIIEEAEVSSRQHLYAPMRSLHRYLVSHHGACEINWFALSQATEQGLVHVNANLVHEHEYFRALELLRADEAMPARMRSLQAAVLVLLYRFGLRIAECLGLRSDDLVFDAGSRRWSVLVRANPYRGLKTPSARRCVVQLEDFDEREHTLLAAWTQHVSRYGDPQGGQPLFAAGTAGQQRTELFPRRLIALRVVQALRCACGDPAVRIHHCRHAYATRILGLGLGHDLGGTTGHEGRSAGILRLLTSEAAPSRRLVWAVAAHLGHATPATTLQTYFHGGHRQLRAWCASKIWSDGVDVAPVEWAAFATGTSFKTMQRAMQRLRAAGQVAGAVDGAIKPSAADAEREVLMQSSRQRWSQVVVLGCGEPVPLPSSLPPLGLLDESDVLSSADAIVEHWRRFGRVDGLAELLQVPEPWIEHVLAAAAELTACHRTSRTPPDGRWIEAPQATYHQHEQEQVRQALNRLNGLAVEQREAACALIKHSLVPAQRMIVVEDVMALEALVALSRQLVDDTAHVVLLVPTKRGSRDPVQKTKAVKSKINGPNLQPSHESLDLEGITAMTQKARQLGIGIEVHGRVAGAREGSHNWLRPSDRAALTVKRNNIDRVRSAKVYVRVLAIAAVAWQAQATLAKTC